MTDKQNSQAVEAAVFEALPNFQRRDDYLLAGGASVMSENCHEIIHVDTLRKIIAAARVTLARPVAEVAAPVRDAPEAVVTGMLYGFASWLTCQPETISVGSRETAYQIIDALKAFADHHKLSLDSPDVENWRQRVVATQPAGAGVSVGAIEDIHGLLTATPAPSVPAGGGEHLFEFWWAEYMPDAPQANAWEAWQAAPKARNVGVTTPLQPQDAAPAEAQGNAVQDGKDAQIAAAFDEGWRLCAQWSQRDDLLADMDSKPYKKNRCFRIAAILSTSAVSGGSGS